MLWVTTIFIPQCATLCATYYLSYDTLARWLDAIASFMIFIGIGVGLLARYIVQEPLASPLYSCILFVCMLIMSFSFLRVRYIYATGTAVLLTIWYLVQFFIMVSLDNSDFDDTMSIVVFAVLCGNVMIAYNSYSSELFYRAQFIAARNLKRTNTKLMTHLKVLQKSYNAGTADSILRLRKPS